MRDRLQKYRILTRALNKARCKRTLTLILSLTGRGNRNPDFVAGPCSQNPSFPSRTKRSVSVLSLLGRGLR